MSALAVRERDGLVRFGIEPRRCVAVHRLAMADGSK
jgi:hypothetical protein